MKSDTYEVWAQTQDGRFVIYRCPSVQAIFRYVAPTDGTTNTIQFFDGGSFDGLGAALVTEKCDHPSVRMLKDTDPDVMYVDELIERMKQENDPRLKYLKEGCRQTCPNCNEDE